MMKRMGILAMAILLLLALAACGGKKADGIYTAQVDAAYAEEKGHGWVDTLTITYKDGVVVEAVFESFKDGQKKSELSTAEYPMPMPPSEWMPALAENVVEAGSSDKVDTIAGATNASDVVKQLFAAIEKDGKAGETITVQILAV